MKWNAPRLACFLAAGLLLLAEAAAAQSLTDPDAEPGSRQPENCFCGAETGSADPFCFEDDFCDELADCTTTADCQVGEICLSSDNFCFVRKCAVSCGDCTVPGGLPEGFELCEDPAPAPTPTLGQWGLIALAIVLALLGFAKLSPSNSKRRKVWLSVWLLASLAAGGATVWMELTPAKCGSGRAESRPGEAPVRLVGS